MLSMNAEHLNQHMPIHWSADASSCKECLSSSSCTLITSLQSLKTLLLIVICKEFAPNLRMQHNTYIFTQVKILKILNQRLKQK